MITDSSNILQIPLLAGVPQVFTVPLAGVQYQMTLTYHDAINAGWMLDIATAEGTPILSGIALVIGLDLLEPYAIAALPAGSFYVMNLPVIDAMPTFESLGDTTSLYFVT